MRRLPGIRGNTGPRPEIAGIAWVCDNGTKAREPTCIQGMRFSRFGSAKIGKVQV